MTTKLVVVGVSGHGRETVDIIEAINDIQPDTFDLVGVLDAGPSDKNLSLISDRGIRYLGTEDAWLERHPDPSIRYVIGIADPSIKHRVDCKFSAAGFAPQTLVHPRANIGTQCLLGEGTVLWPGASITTNVVTGRHVSLNNNVTVGHDTHIGDYCSVHPNASISGDVNLASSVLVGSGAVILQGLSLACGTTVGACACVTKDIGNEETTVVGIPAHPAPSRL